MTFRVSVPADAQAGSYPLGLTAGDAHATGALTVIGDTIEFTPDTPAEAPWLFEPDGSQLDGAVKPDDGWGAWLGHLKLELQRSG